MSLESFEECSRQNLEENAWGSLICDVAPYLGSQGDRKDREEARKEQVNKGRKEK